MKKLLLILFIGMFLISITSAQESSLGTFKQGEDIELIQTCSDCTYNNITKIKLANGTLLKIDESMTKDGSFFSYTLNSTYTTSLGEYKVNGIGDTGGVDTVWTYSLQVTPTGQNFTGGQSIGALGLLGAALVLAFFFMFLGFKIGVEPKLLPISFFLVMISIGLGIYSLNMSWVISNNIILDSAISSTAEVVYITVLWMAVSLAVISSALMLISFIKELSNIVTRRKMGDGYNPLTDMYE